MKSSRLPIIMLALVVASTALAADEIPDSDLGLSKSSVFETPVPQAFDYDGSAPAIAAMNSHEVPVIPHEVRHFELITIGSNRCLRCHVLPSSLGGPDASANPTPTPASHYREKSSENDPPRIAGARWVCTQCHVAQSNVEPLVGNSTME